MPSIRFHNLSRSVCLCWLEVGSSVFFFFSFLLTYHILIFLHNEIDASHRVVVCFDVDTTYVVVYMATNVRFGMASMQCLQCRSRAIFLCFIFFVHICFIVFFAVAALSSAFVCLCCSVPSLLKHATNECMHHFDSRLCSIKANASALCYGD